MRAPAQVFAAILAALLCLLVTACGEDTIAPPIVPDSAPAVAPESLYDTITAGELLQFPVSADDDSRLVSIRADWRDGTPASVIELDSARFEGSFPHVYLDPGIYSVRITATDDAGQEGLGGGVVWVEVRDDPPIVAVTAPDTVVVLEEFSVHFEADDEHGVDRVILDFGDGDPPREFVANQSMCPPTCFRAMVASPRHIYFHPGDYRVSLQVLDLAGQSVTWWGTITAVTAP